MERDELAGWLRLTLAPGVGNESARKLLAAFGLPHAIFAQSATALQQVVSRAQASALQAGPPGLADLVERTWQWLQGDTAHPADGAPRHVVALGDAEYPAALLAIEDPPLMLYLLGGLAEAAKSGPEQAPVHAERAPDATNLIANSAQRSIAIVGSRNPTPQGEANARQFARAFAEAGLTVVSGLALGVDGAAHQGALDGAGAAPGQLATIAVVGTGLDRVYPKKHLALAHRIAQHGLIISEFPLGTPPLMANFPKRNRIISGLSVGTLVVEAALQSGSLITARLAAEQGKEVFAIPGSIHSPQSRGCHALIKQGAKLVELAQDVLEELHLPLAAGSNERFGAASQTPDGAAPDSTQAAPDPLLEALGFDAVSLDALQARTGLQTARLQAQLLELELNGQLARLPGGLFQRLAAG